MILITGATGLIGSHLLLELVTRGQKVRALRRKTSSTEMVRKIFSYCTAEQDRLYALIEWAEGDLLDTGSLEKALEGVDYLYHCAALVSFESGRSREMIDNNVSGTANVVNACLNQGIKRLCYVSSTAAIGRGSDGAPADETNIWKHSGNRSPYSVSKYLSEMEIWRGIAEGLTAVIVNPSVVIGPGDWSRSSPRIFKAVWEGLNFYTNGVTGYVDIHDVVRCMIHLMESDISEERFILSAENLSFRELFDMVARALGKQPPRIYAHPVITAIAWRLDWLISRLTFRQQRITRQNARSAHQKAMFSNDKIRSATGMEFTPIRQSIEKTAKLFLNDL